MQRTKTWIAIGVLAWSGFAVGAYFVVQKPLAMQAADHLIGLGGSLLWTALLVCNGLAFGLMTVRRVVAGAAEDASTLALATGIGLGGLGLLGFLLAAAGAAQGPILLGIQLLLLGLAAWLRLPQQVVSLAGRSLAQIRSSAAALPAWMRWAAVLAITLTFLMTLLPPADAFDALLYHLTVPARWIQDGGLRPYDFPHYWFPGLVEGMYVWGLGLGSEIVPQQIHFVYALCTILLAWHWARRLWGDLAAGWTAMLLVSMPSLWLLASWAYTDLALIFFGLASLYTLSRGQEDADRRWWRLSAVGAGLAMGVKYTSFVVPVTALLLITAWTLHRRQEWIAEVSRFVLLSVITGGIWYLRNWIWMGNPVYPFVFGGRYWDSFRADWFANPGTGTGWDIGALILLPLTVTLGYQDINGIDADIGPLLLLALPLGLWVLVTKREAGRGTRISLLSIGSFSLLSAAFWVYGYITTRNLWQARLLLPAIVPFVIPLAAGLASLRRFDTQRFRLSFIVTAIAALSIYTNLLDTGLSVIARNPLAPAAGITTGQSYLEKYQPGYAFARDAIARIPSNAKVYALFEPRSYGMARFMQPDPILDNFSHDVFLYGGAERIIEAWQTEGYTHILVRRDAADLVLQEPAERAIFVEIMDFLRPVAASPGGAYELLEIPAR